MLIFRALKIESDKEENDQGVHDLYDTTGDDTDDVTGDSAIVMGCKLPYSAKPPPLITLGRSSPDTYKKLNLKTMNADSPYASLTDTTKKKTSGHP